MYPNLTDLRYFQEIAYTGHDTQAATRLGVTQPTLSVALVRLETSLGTQILQRSKKGVHLTPAGRTLLAYTKNLIQEWESVQTKALASHNEVKGQFTIGCHPSVAQYTLPQMLPQLLRAHQELDIHLYHDLSRKVIDAIIDVDIDIGVVVNPIRHPDLIIKKICEDEVTLWRSTGSYNQDVMIADLELTQSQHILKRLKKVGLNPKRFIKSSNLEVIATLTKSGTGIGILPSRVAKQHKNLKPIPNSPVFKDEICIAYRMESRQIKAIQVISDALQIALKS